MVQPFDACKKIKETLHVVIRNDLQNLFLSEKNKAQNNVHTIISVKMHRINLEGYRRNLCSEYLCTEN